MNLSNHTGIIGRSFTFGLPPNQATITINEDGTYVLSGSIDIGAAKFKSSGVASDPNDIPNFELLSTSLEQLYIDANKYVDKKISELTGGTTGGNVMLNPIDVNVADLADNLHLPFGDLDANKFIERIAFEVTEPFARVDGTDFEIAIGTTTQPEAYYPYTQLSTFAAGTTFIDVGKTLPVTTNIVLHIRRYVPPAPPPDPFEQRFNNLHPDTVTSQMSSDASGKVITFTVTGTDLVGAISDTITFPPEKVSGNFMDFAFNLNLTAGTRYKVVEMNSALALFTGDAGVIENSGVWEKTTTFEPATGEVMYPFILGASAGASDYAHVYLYNLDSETPTEAIMTYHIKNELTFAATPAVMSLSAESGSSDPLSGNGLQIVYPSISEGPITCTFRDDGQGVFTTDVAVMGAVGTRNEDLQSVYPGLEGDCTYIDIFTQLVAGHNYRISIYSDLFASIYGKAPEVQMTNDVFFISESYETSAADSNRVAKITVPFANTAHGAGVNIIDLTDGTNWFVNVDSTKLEIVNTTNLLMQDIRADAMLMAANVSMFAVDADTGRLKARVLSF